MRDIKKLFQHKPFWSLKNPAIWVIIGFSIKGTITLSAALLAAYYLI